jgi:hypothetical protein
MSGSTISGLTDQQWSEIELALGVLVFFAGTHVVASWRHGRGGG